MSMSTPCERREAMIDDVEAGDAEPAELLAMTLFSDQCDGFCGT